MSEYTVRLPENFGKPVYLNPYQLPPLFVITEHPSVKWVLAQATCKAHRKYLVHQMIMGQPFYKNRGK